jgi:hypothetical protein
VLRIHFSGTDLGRVRVASQPDVMWEMILSLHQLVRPHAFFAPWNRLARKALTKAEIGQDVHLLTTLAPNSSYFPDFLTPSGHITVLGSGIDKVMSTGRQRLRAEIGRLVDSRPYPPSWLDDIGAGRPRALRRLGNALHRYHATVMAPYASDAAERAGREAARFARRALDQGSEALLGSLGPSARWRPPKLEVDYPVTRHLSLDGRGLLLIPSHFCHDHPIALADPELPPVLIYPVARGPLWIPSTAELGPGGRGLDELIGSTRAAALRSLDTAHSTTALATRLCTSAATASRHAAALRRAGLVITERAGSCVLHTRTTLGTSLVHGR